MKKDIKILLLEYYLRISILMCVIGLFLIPTAIWLVGFSFVVFLIYTIEIKLQKTNGKPKGWLLVYEVIKSTIWNIGEKIINFFLYVVMLVFVGPTMLYNHLSNLDRGEGWEKNLAHFIRAALLIGGVVLLVLLVWSLFEHGAYMITSWTY